MLQNFRLFTRNPRVYIWEMHSPRVNLWGIQNGKGNNVEILQSIFGYKYSESG